ncbi:MAG TPA: DinB family protein [Chitinophagaceae bacterium]|nr:DinB family protein [Chitinophagaceae bacterium]
MITQKIEIEKVFVSIDDTTSRFLELVSSFNSENINTIPFENCWTVAQVAEHITRSNNSIICSLQQNGKIISRSVDQRVQGLKDVFLNFDSKLQSPRFILPTRDIYERAAAIRELKTSIEELKETARKIDYQEGINHAIFGEITKLELLHFVIYHTQRHLRQLTNIHRQIATKNLTGSRKVILSIHTSLDGFVAGLNGKTDWITIDDEIFKDSNDVARTADVALYGRTTFQMMKSYWPSVLTNSNSTEAELEHARWMEHVHKIVFSTTLEQVNWNNTKLVRANVPGEITKLKQIPGRNIIIIGSPSLADSFIKHDLIDEYRINLNPVVLGRGVPLFKDVDDRLTLKLRSSKIFNSGVVGLVYETKTLKNY